MLHLLITDAAAVRVFQMPIKFDIAGEDLLAWRNANISDVMDCHLMLKPFTATCKHDILYSTPSISTYIGSEVLHNMLLPLPITFDIGDPSIADLTIKCLSFEAAWWRHWKR